MMSAGRARGYESARAWAARNLLVCAVNEALAQGLFGLAPGPVDDAILPFTVAGQPCRLRAHGSVFDEVHITADVAATDAIQHLGVAYLALGLFGRDACVTGWLERREGRHLHSNIGFVCRRALQPLLAAVSVDPAGYSDHAPTEAQRVRR